MAVVWRDGEAVARKGDGLREELAPRQSAKALMHCRDPGEHAWDRDRKRPDPRNAAGITFRSRGRRSGARAVEHDSARARLFVDLVKAVAAQPRHHRLDDGQCHCRCDGRVDCVPTGPQRHQPGLGRERVVCRDRPASSDNQRTIAARFNVHVHLLRHSWLAAVAGEVLFARAQIMRGVRTNAQTRSSVFAGSRLAKITRLV